MMEAMRSSNIAGNDLPDYAASYPTTSRSENECSCGDVTTNFLSVFTLQLLTKRGRSGAGKPNQTWLAQQIYGVNVQLQ
jgi:hypothetical protein